MMLVVTFVLLAAGVLLGLLIARATLTLLFALLGVNHQFLVRWHVVAFATMLFWSWYFAPSLSAM
jgi:hypothetical protein